MAASVIHNASSLSVEERRVIEKLLGRPLQEAELFEVHTLNSAVIKEAATGPEREEAFERLSSLLDRAAENVADVPDEELDALIEEAIAETRRSRR